LNLQQTEEEILAQMKKSTRYEVRRIEKLGIKVVQNQDLEIFWKLHLATIKRQKFVPFPRENTARQLNIFGQDCQIFSAEKDGEFLSSSIIIFDEQSAYYYQGSSIYSKLPMAHATLWSAILVAKKRGCRTFNFWGVVDDEMKNHPWYGLSRFKKGFGGEVQKFIHCQDFPITKKYWLNFCLEKWRKWKRGY